MSQSPKPAPRNPWPLRIVLVLVVLGAAAWGVTYALRAEATVVAAWTGTAVRVVPGTVEVKAELDRPLKSEVGGRVLSSSLAIGKRVFRNDTLVQIDTGDIDIEIDRIKNEIVAAKRKVELGSLLRADLLNAKDNLDNNERRMKAGTYPASEFEKEKRLYQQLQQRMELDEVNLKLVLQNFQNSLLSKEREKAKMTIVAPFDGIITTVDTGVGDLIGSNSPIATIIAVSRTIVAKLSEENFAQIKLGQKAKVRFLTFGDRNFDAVISQVLPSADAATQRYTVYLDMVVPEGTVLVPGLTGEVSFIIEQRANATMIPRRALVGDYVYVAEGNQLALRKVRRGFDGLNEVEIAEGIKPGDLVVVEQQDLFRDGDHVRLNVIKETQ